MKSKGLAVIGMLAIAAFGAYRVAQAPHQESSDNNPTTSSPVSVTVATVTRGDMLLTIEASGRVEAKTSVLVKAQVDGQVADVAFREGRPVHKGQLLFRLDPSAAQAQVRQAEGVLARDEAQLTKVHNDATRNQALAGQGFISPSGLAQSEADMKSAQATLIADTASRDAARLQLEHCRITAPIDGVAGAALVPVGGAARANDSTLVVINQVEPIYVTFSLPESQLATVKSAMTRGPVSVIAHVVGDERAIAGWLAFIDNAVDATSGSIMAKALFDNADRFLTPGQFANVTVQVGLLKQVASVPDAAVESGVDGSYTFVVGAHTTVEMRRVKAGVKSGGHTVVAEGLSVGERVVTSGQARLRDKDRVTIASEAPAVADR